MRFPWFKITNKSLVNYLAREVKDLEVLVRFTQGSNGDDLCT
jgi:hypothetical protein